MNVSALELEAHLVVKGGMGLERAAELAAYLLDLDERREDGVERARRRLDVESEDRFENEAARQ